MHNSTSPTAERVACSGCMPQGGMGRLSAGQGVAVVGTARRDVFCGRGGGGVRKISVSNVGTAGRMINQTATCFMAVAYNRFSTAGPWTIVRPSSKTRFQKSSGSTVRGYSIS
jgi:hypothetical protein